MPIVTQVVRRVVPTIDNDRLWHAAITSSWSSTCSMDVMPVLLAGIYGRSMREARRNLAKKLHTERMPYSAHQESSSGRAARNICCQQPGPACAAQAIIQNFKEMRHTVSGDYSPLSILHQRGDIITSHTVKQWRAYSAPCALAGQCWQMQAIGAATTRRAMVSPGGTSNFPQALSDEGMAVWATTL